MTIPTIDADVYFLNQNTTPSDYNVNPVFQTAVDGLTTLPPELVMTTMTGRNGLNSAGSADAYWNMSMTAGEKEGKVSGNFINDASDNAITARTQFHSYPVVASTGSAYQVLGRIINWAGQSEGRGYSNDMFYNVQQQRIFSTSLRFNPMPWHLTTLQLPSSNENNYQIAFPFAPDWVWMWSSWPGSTADEWASTHALANTGNCFYNETFAHRDGTIQGWQFWDQDTPTTMNCGTSYSETEFMRAYWTSGAYTEYVSDITFTDSGITLDWTGTNSYNMHILAGKNENSKVGKFRITTSDYGDGTYRSSDNTMKITTGFRPRVVFLIGGNRSSSGGSSHVQMGRGFIGPTGEEWAMSISNQDNIATSDCYGSNWDNRCYHLLNSSGGSSYSNCSFNSYEDDGFRVNVDDAGSYNVSYLAFADPPPEVQAPYGDSIL